ncbi:MAG: ABC transporter permease [Planctomycetota bacterium]
MNKLMKIAVREFSSTVLTKGFIIGAIVIPAIIAAAMPLVIRLIQKAEEAAPIVDGTLAVIDRTGGDLTGGDLTGPIGERLSHEDGSVFEPGGIDPETIDPEDPMSAIGQVTGARSTINLEVLDSATDVESERDAMREAYREGMTGERLGLAVIPEGSVLGDGEGEFPQVEFYHRRKLDDRVIGKMRAAVTRTIRDARFEAANLDRDRIDAISDVSTQTQEISETGEAEDSKAAAGIIVPVAMLLLLIVSVMTGGQYLLTTTVEEKNSRVVEVLLSAVSPMELMFGKILGQMGVGLALLVMYSGVTIIVASVFGLASGLVTPELITGLIVFFLIAYVTMASLLAAIGAAVNELREAQSLMTPVMMTLMIPYFLIFPISRDPNSTLALVLSYLPPVSPFVMVIRLGSTQPPPLWQTASAAVVGAIGAYAAVWFAAKVFRIGLLQFGKAPDFKTLVRWVKMA